MIIADFSMGAHIAAQICRYLYDQFKEKCKMILGLDAAGVEFALALDRYIKRGDADYVQLIITNPKGFLSRGTKKAVGDDNIYFKKFKSNWFRNKHLFACQLHYRIITGHTVVVADPDGIGIIENFRYMTQSSQRAGVIRPEVNDYQCLVGIYSTSHARNQHRNFTVTIGEQKEDIYNSFLPPDDVNQST